MKFLSWTLHAPQNVLFHQFRQLASGEPWWSDNWEVVSEDIPSTWDVHTTGFVKGIMNNHSKMTSIGLHDFGVNAQGRIFDFKTFTPAGGWDTNALVLNADRTDIIRPCVSSLRWLMQNYPDIEWAIQPICMQTPAIEAILDNPNGQADTFLEELYAVADIYIKRGFNFQTIEMDFEKAETRHHVQEWNLYAELLRRVKNEVCIPLGLELRVNLFSMTGDLTPDYFAWHDYRSLERPRDINGNRVLDQVQLMTYDFHWAGSSPGPSTPLWWLPMVLEHSASIFPPSITYPGNAGYGRRWPLHIRAWGVTLTYRQAMLHKNGMWTHNTNRLADLNEFHFNDQDWIPWGSVNHADSDYLITFPHMYDRLQADHASNGIYNGFHSMIRASDYLTNFSRSQRPEFTGIHAVMTTPSTVVGNAILQQDVRFIEGGLNHTFRMWSTQNAAWWFDPVLQSCSVQGAPQGVNGQLIYNFNVPAGNRRLVMMVGFPFFGSDNFEITVNSTLVRVGDGLPEWYPFITNPSWHFLDLGIFNFNTSNTITVGVTNGAWVGGFVVCDGFISNLRGGHAYFETNLTPFKKRGAKQANSTSQIIDAQYPDEMTVTGEILRRPPRPAIIWEDPWGPHLLGAGFTPDHDLTNFIFYQRANPQAFSINSGSQQHQVGNTTHCISGLLTVGFSRGVWRVVDEYQGAPSYVWSDTRSEYSQIVLNRRFRCNMRVEVDCRALSQDTNARLGIIIATEPGRNDQGFLFRLNFENNRIEFIDRQNSANNRFAAFPAFLVGQHATRRILALDVLNGSLGFWSGDNRYFLFNMNLPEFKAYGFYAEDCEARSFRMTIATLDRWETMEELALEIDGDVVSHGRIPRNVPRDEFDYIIFTGLTGNMGAAVWVAESGVANPNQQPGRVGTIYSTETVPEIWDMDYQNHPIFTRESWLGDKDVILHMTDPGLWFRTLYVGDTQGYSIAYNSDKIGFIRTIRMILDYGFKGISMWTLGQEDPRIFDHYIPSPRN